MRTLTSIVGVSLAVVVSMPFAATAQVEGDVRLVGGSSSNEGRVEVFHNGEWGTVCDDIWTRENADVVCRQLGLGRALEFPCCAFFGAGTGPIWMDEVNCAGSESRLVECPFLGFGVHNCGHHEDAGVVCSGSTPAPAMSTAALTFAALALIASGAVVLRRRNQAI